MLNKATVLIAALDSRLVDGVWPRGQHQFQHHLQQDVTNSDVVLLCCRCTITCNSIQSTDPDICQQNQIYLFAPLSFTAFKLWCWSTEWKSMFSIKRPPPFKKCLLYQKIKSKMCQSTPAQLSIGMLSSSVFNQNPCTPSRGQISRAVRKGSPYQTFQSPKD